MRIDDRVAIAHNKVILIDGRILVGGSYNYSESAEKRNAENLLIIRDHEVIAEYRENWHGRKQVSRPLSLRP